MRTDPAETLRILFAIPQDEIDRDIAAFSNLLGLVAPGVPRQRPDSAESSARHHHESMVKAKVFSERGSIPPEFSLFFAALSAEHIAELACDVAYSKGRIAEIGQRMKEIEVREGLEDGEYWPLGDGPEDYQELVGEIESLYGAVRDSVMTTMLIRYRMEDFSAMYESDRQRFDDLREQGRKQSFEPSKKRRKRK